MRRGENLEEDVEVSKEVGKPRKRRARLEGKGKVSIEWLEEGGGRLDTGRVLQGGHITMYSITYPRITML